MNSKIKELFKLVDDAYDEILTEFIKLEKDLPQADIYECTDWTYAAREMSDKLKALRIKSDHLRKNCTNIVCALFTVEPDTSPIYKKGHIKTDYCTGTPDLKSCAHIPKQRTHPEEYETLMDFFGVPHVLVEKDIVRPHWPGLVDYLSELLSAGKALPPGIDPTKTYPVYDMQIRKKKGVLE